MALTKSEFASLYLPTHQYVKTFNKTTMPCCILCCAHLCKAPICGVYMNGLTIDYNAIYNDWLINLLPAEDSSLLRSHRYAKHDECESRFPKFRRLLSSSDEKQRMELYNHVKKFDHFHTCVSYQVIVTDRYRIYQKSITPTLTLLDKLSILSFAEEIGGEVRRDERGDVEMREGLDKDDEEKKE